MRELLVSAERLGLRVALRIEETGSGAMNDRPGLVFDAIRDLMEPSVPASRPIGFTKESKGP